MQTVSKSRSKLFQIPKRNCVSHSDEDASIDNSPKDKLQSEIFQASKDQVLNQSSKCKDQYRQDNL